MTLRPEPGNGSPNLLSRVKALGAGPAAAFRLLNPFGAEAPLDLRIVGRALLHAGLVGVAAGIIGAAFFASLELGQRLFLEVLAGFEPLRAHGERFVPPAAPRALRPWALALLPALGALGSGLLSWRFAPETAGGGGDAAIEAYHHGRLVRWRVLPVKFVAAFLTLSSGGAGGREGPTMQIGAAIGSAVSRFLPTTRDERRVLVVAGIAAGISAVFRTPLGAALLATEMLYRDDFAADALVPAILASVVSYSVVIALFGETTVFGTVPRFPFTLRHLPLYAIAGLAVSVAAVAFLKLLRAVQRSARALPAPPWARPAIGGALMGVTGTALALWMRASYGPEALGFGVFGGGYGTVQAAMTGQGWMPAGLRVVALLAAVAAVKMIASALTIGSGAAAGDFAPTLVIGGLLGSGFGHLARVVLADPTIDPAAFALVGMGTFYGGLAHAPLSALVLVAELAGSYDLLVPMMLAIGIAYVALRRHSLYPAQLPSRAAPAPAGGEDLFASLARRPVRDLAVPPELDAFDERASLQDLATAGARALGQRVVVVTGAGGPRGLVELATLADLPPAERGWMRARDAVVPFASVSAAASWGEVAALLERCGLSQVPVLDRGAVVGWIGDRELRRALLAPGADAIT
jgi:CIC family chloride channel protein